MGIEELKIVAPLQSEERHAVFLPKKPVIDTLAELVTIDKDRNLNVQIRLNLLGIVREAAEGAGSTGVQVSKDGIHTRIFDIYRAGQVAAEL